jgi:putative toxin-antitoxin system antitoxin component (TIGR02293 family)
MTSTTAQKKLTGELTMLLRKSDLNDRRIPKSMDLAAVLGNKMLLVHLIREGLPYRVFELIRNTSPFTFEDWSVFLNISNKTLQRYKAAKSRFKAPHSEKILELAEVLNTGMLVFQDIDKLKQWLHTENYALGNFRPMDLLSDSYGKELVLSELIRIDEGIFV